MRIYIDTSAFVKLLVEEPESAALDAFLTAQRPLDLISSVLLETEARRVASRVDVDQATVTTALASVNLLDAPRALFTEAGLLPIASLRSLDALHLATAIRNAADLLVAHDARLLEAATAHGIPTASPS